MTEQQRTGRIILLVFITAVVALSLFVVVLYVSRLGNQRIERQVVRFVLTIGLCVWLYQGSAAARWTTIVLLGAGGGLGLYLLLSPGLPLEGQLLMLAMVAVYLSFVVVLLFSQSVLAFLKYQSGSSSD